MMLPDTNRQDEVELRRAMYDMRHADGLSKAVEYAMMQQQRSLRLMTKCAPDELKTYQGEYAAYQRMIDAIMKPVATGESK